MLELFCMTLVLVFPPLHWVKSFLFPMGFEDCNTGMETEHSRLTQQWKDTATYQVISFHSLTNKLYFIIWFKSFPLNTVGPGDSPLLVSLVLHSAQARHLLPSSKMRNNNNKMTNCCEIMWPAWIWGSVHGLSWTMTQVLPSSNLEKKN